jgi:hypothetical protein
MEILTTTKTTTQEIQSININSLDLIKLVESKGITIPAGSRIQVFIKVPSGGNYSGMHLDIDDSFPVHVTIEAGQKESISDGDPETI